MSAHLLHDGPGTRVPPRVARAAHDFLEAGGSGFGRALRRCPHVVVAEADGRIVAVVAWHEHSLMLGESQLDCVFIELAAFAPGWSRHVPLLSCLVEALGGRRDRERVLLWADSPDLPLPSHLAALLEEADARPPGRLAAARDRLLSRIAPRRWDPLDAVLRDDEPSRRRRPRPVHVVPVTHSLRVAARALSIAAVLQTPVRLPALPSLAPSRGPAPR